MMYWLARLEETAVSVAIRETGWMFFTSLTVHSLSMAFAAGVNIMLCLRVLGMARRVELPRFMAFMPTMWTAITLVALSGALLLMAYPAKGLTNEVFYLKLLALAVGLVITARLCRSVTIETEQDKQGWQLSKQGLAAVGFFSWLLVIGAGRFLAYTHSILLASSFY